MTDVRRAAVMYAAVALTVLGAGQVQAQVSTRDKHFLKESSEDSNFEIKTGQLALQKSNSQDVKDYAHMVIQDHEQLKQDVQAADSATAVQPVGDDAMAAKDKAEFAKLEGLQGDAFDQAYIKELVKGNKESLAKSQSEASGGTAQAVKLLAQKQADVDRKHTEKGQQLAQAHHVLG